MNRLAGFLALVLLGTWIFACAAGESIAAQPSSSCVRGSQTDLCSLSQSARTPAQARSSAVAASAPLIEQRPEPVVGAAAAPGAVPAARTSSLFLEELPEGGHWLMIVSGLAIAAFIARRRLHSVHP